MLIIFNHGSMSIPTEDVVECSVKHKHKCDSYIVTVKKSAKVQYNYYRPDWRVTEQELEDYIILEGEAGDTSPHIFFNR